VVADNGTGLPPYFPRDVDQDLRAALEARPPAVLVVAQSMSGAARTIYEALQKACPDKRLLLADELVASSLGVTPEELLLSDSDLVWVPNLGRLAQQMPELRKWFTVNRHMVVATVIAVVRPKDEALIAELGLDRDAVRFEMRSQLSATERGAASVAFDREMTTIGEVVRASRRRQPGQARYLADDYAGFGRITQENDALGIAQDVQMLASLVASKQITPPISIGLFGPWGSGKSFLMNQIKLGAVDLANRSSALGAHQTSAYCSKVVPVDFNAWQYVHGADLWASLVSKVFEGIREELDDAPAYQALWRDVRERSSDVASAQQELADAEAELRATTKKAEDRPIASLAAEDPQVAENAQTLKKTIDLDPVTTQVGTLRTEVTELRTVAGKFSRGWRGASRLRRLAVIGLVVLGGVVAAALVWMGFTSGGEVVPLLLAAVPVLAAINAVIKPARLALRAGVDILDADRRRYDDARRRRDEASAALAGLRSQGPAALYGYVSDRSTASDYRQHLGVGPMIREDLARLAALASGGEDGPIIDRIVIFIDDLDRCPAKVVVRVLEAVNLLFAHSLFVVVIAVDSRWLIKSLNSEFNTTFTQDDTDAPTAQNYLEKIIQIPFWLQPVRKDAFGRLVANLIGDVDEDNDVTLASTTTDDGTEPIPDELPWHSGGDSAPQHGTASTLTAGPPASAGVAVSQGSVAISSESPAEVDLNPAALRITAAERDYLRGFHDLVTTPRATKRFLNTYQLLRAGIGDIDDYLANQEYRPVLILLALVTGTSLTDQRMVEQLRAMGEPNLGDFLADRSSDHQWTPVQTACGGLPITLVTPAVIDKWCVRVARYSFHPITH
jgi:hypothetical protein